MIFLFHKIFGLPLLIQIHNWTRLTLFSDRKLTIEPNAAVSPVIFNETLVVQQLVVTVPAGFFFILLLFGLHVRDLDLKLRPALFGPQSSHVAVAVNHVSWWTHSNTNTASCTTQRHTVASVTLIIWHTFHLPAFMECFMSTQNPQSKS